MLAASRWHFSGGSSARCIGCVSLRHILRTWADLLELSVTSFLMSFSQSL